VATLSTAELSVQTGVPVERIEWLIEIGLIRPREPGGLVPGDGFRAKMVDALIRAGTSTEQIELAVRQHMLDLSHVDNYMLVDTEERSHRTFGQFLEDKADSLASIYTILGFPQPAPDTHLPVIEEDLLERFSTAWAHAQDDQALSRAARILAEGTRHIVGGWAALFDEQISGPARERLLRGEVDTWPHELTKSSIAMYQVMPRLMAWLSDRYVEQLIVAGIVERFEEFLASRGLARAPSPGPPPAVVFVDISGFTRLTERLGDEAAAQASNLLHEQAEAIAAEHDGRLVKLLGDGAMLLFREPSHGVSAAVELVRHLTEDQQLPAHAGIHVGPVIQRDMDVFGRTVNLASRLADRAAPGDIVASGAVREQVSDGFRFEEIEHSTLKGFVEPVTLYRVRPLADLVTGDD
jgi:adenylate cyclase